MVQWIRHFFKKLRLFFIYNFTEEGRNYVRCELANKVLEANGLKALRWDDGVPLNVDNLSRGEMDLYFAVKTLRRSGCVIVDKQWRLIGSVHQNYFESSDERAQKRRESFQLVRGEIAADRNEPI
jgi:hypothetical protein